MRRIGSFVDRFEEGVLAVLLASMTVVSFTQVIARYVFNTGWTGALEFTRILFAWLIIFGMSYGVKIGSHLGVDAFIRLMPRRAFRAAAAFGAVCTIAYALILLDSDWLKAVGIDARGGAIDYWLRMYRVGIGLDDLRYPDWMQEAFGIQDRIHRWMAYLILPIGLALLALRAAQALVAIVAGRRESIVAGHEAEDLLADHLGAKVGDDPPSATNRLR
jgi:C4-dicarboxylate transporter DctQ subunit